MNMAATHDLRVLNLAISSVAARRHRGGGGLVLRRLPPGFRVGVDAVSTVASISIITADCIVMVE
jgi:hypothetical protein